MEKRKYAKADKNNTTLELNKFGKGYVEYISSFFIIFMVKHLYANQHYEP